MARDYARKRAPKRKTSRKKHTRSSSKKQSSKKMFLAGAFLTIGLLVCLFGVGVLYLNSATHNETKPQVAKAISKPKFNFNTMLPSQKQHESKPKDKPIQYTLQVASVKDDKDADRLRAQLLLLGFDASISKATKNLTLWHRINVGPFKSEKKALAEQKRLHEHHINSLLLKSPG